MSAELQPLTCPMCKNHLGIQRADGAFFFRWRGRAITLRPGATGSVTCEECGETTELDALPAKALA